MIFTKPYADALIVLLVILLFFGPKRLPALGKSLGDGLREFKDSIGGKSKDSEEKPQLESASANPVPEREHAAQAAAPAEQSRAETSSQSQS
jgi:sec-independent protein translocase protein TatA